MICTVQYFSMYNNAARTQTAFFKVGEYGGVGFEVRTTKLVIIKLIFNIL